MYPKVTGLGVSIIEDGIRMLANEDLGDWFPPRRLGRILYAKIDKILPCSITCPYCECDVDIIIDVNDIVNTVLKTIDIYNKENNNA